MKSRFAPARKALIFWTLFIGLGAVGGAACMLADPSGRSVGMSGMLPYFQVLPFADVLFQDLFFSGIALLLVNGVTNLTAAALLFRKEVGQEVILRHETALARRFYDRVRDIPGIRLYGNFESSLRAPIVALNLADADSGAVADALWERWGIAVRPGAHCAPRLHRALGTEEQGAVRFSWSYFNTAEETDAAAAALRVLAEE